MKRKRAAHVGDRHRKRSRPASDQSAIATTPGVDHPVLRRLYPEVVTLRHYLLSRLPGTSKNRRRKISQLGLPNPNGSPAATRGPDVELGQLLDSTLVGVPVKGDTEVPDDSADARDRDIELFSQQLPDCATGSTFKPGYFLQPEVGVFTQYHVVDYN
jgi:hypothetical protein